MTRFYRITPLEENSVEYFVDVFERMPDESIRGFDVTERWGWGFGYRSEDEPVWKYEAETDNGVHCQPEVGLGCDLDQFLGVVVNFTDGFSQEEQQEIEALIKREKTDEYGRSGISWVYDGDHNYEIESDHVRITKPVKIDLIDSTGSLIATNISPHDPG